MFTPTADSSRSFLVHHSFIFVLVNVKKKKKKKQLDKGVSF